MQNVNFFLQNLLSHEKLGNRTGEKKRNKMDRNGLIQKLEKKNKKKEKQRRRTKRKPLYSKSFVTSSIDLKVFALRTKFLANSKALISHGTRELISSIESRSAT